MRFRDSVTLSHLAYPTLSSEALTSGDIISERRDQKGHRILVERCWPPPILQFMSGS